MKQICQAAVHEVLNNLCHEKWRKKPGAYSLDAYYISTINLFKRGLSCLNKIT